MTAPTVPTPRQRADHPLGALRLGAVRLAVRDIEAATRFWRVAIGLDDLGRSGGVQRLGVGDDTMLELEHVPDAEPPARRSSGLFHLALVVPSRRDLAHNLLRLGRAGARLYGASDHLVSHALYLDDPEGNGIELYWDQPRERWHWSGDGLAMGTLPLDLDELVAKADGTTVPDRMPEGTRLGHVHLRVSDVDVAERWYRDLIGLDTTVRLPGAAFMSVDDYHHHLGLNSWSSQGGPANADDTSGLRHYTIELLEPDRERLLGRLRDDGQTVDQIAGAPSVRDPFGNRIRVSTADVVETPARPEPA